MFKTRFRGLFSFRYYAKDAVIAVRLVSVYVEVA